MLNNNLFLIYVIIITADISKVIFIIIKQPNRESQDIPYLYYSLSYQRGNVSESQSEAQHSGHFLCHET